MNALQSAPRRTSRRPGLAPRLHALVAAGLLVTTASAQDAATLDEELRALAPRLVDATVGIFVGGGSGSGVIVSEDGLILTAAHVVQTPGAELTVLLSDGREVKAEALGTNHDSDAALARIVERGRYPFRPFVKDRTYGVGDLVLATGHPGGPIVGREAPLRLGTISSAGVGGGMDDPIRTSATVISGDSGGPLFDREGRVIGIHSNIGGSWRMNHHVSLPSFVQDWDLLINSGTVGTPQTNGGGEDELPPFDDPYAGLRDQLADAVRRDPERARSTGLDERPRAVPPHEARALLDEWQETPLFGDAVPRLGWSLDPSSRADVVVLQVVPDLPAARAGLAPGDRITSLNGEPVRGLAAFLATLDAPREDAERGPLVLGVEGRAEAITVEPLWVRPRPHFAPPMIGMIQMRMAGGDEQGESGQGELAALEEALGELPAQGDSVQVLEGGRVVASGTAISGSGELITKASELGDDPEDLEVKFDGQRYPLELVGVDEDTDLALLRAEVEGLEPIVWAETEAAQGTLAHARLGRRTLVGVVTQGVRDCPGPGRDFEHRAGQARVWLGVRFDRVHPEPLVQLVEIDGPADRAGLLEGDVIVSVDGVEVATADEVGEAVAAVAPGTRIELELRRAGKTVTARPIVDLRTTPLQSGPSATARGRDDQLRQLSAQGGDLSERSTGLGRCIYHDLPVRPEDCGSPLLDSTGRALGINIARALRHRSLAIPAAEVRAAIERIRAGS